MPPPIEPTRFCPQVQPLEDRTTPAGNITARVVDGTLFIDGDPGSNSVVIAGTGWRSVAVRPGDAETSVNDLPDGQGVFLGDITRGIVVRTGDGEDTVRLVGVKNGYYIGVFTGGGEDQVIFERVEAKGAVEVNTGVADDEVLLTHSNFRKTVAVDLGSGSDRVEAANSRFRDRAFFSAGGIDGTDALGLNASRFSRAVSYSFFDTVVNGPLPPPAVPPIPPENLGPPSVTVSSSAGESTAAAQVPFRLTFSEPVTGLLAEELGVTNGTISDFVADGPTAFTFNVTPAADGAITISVPANVASDSEGLGNTAAAPFTVRSIRTDAGMTDTVPSASDPNFIPTGSGLATWDIQTGTGTPVTDGDTVQVFYTGWLTDGTVFDSARTTGQPATFPLSNLISGFREGMIGMQPGGIRRFLIPPELGYGSTGTGSIPPNATLIFEVKLVAIS